MHNLIINLNERFSFWASSFEEEESVIKSKRFSKKCKLVLAFRRHDAPNHLKTYEVLFVISNVKKGTCLQPIARSEMKRLSTKGPRLEILR